MQGGFKRSRRLSACITKPALAVNGTWKPSASHGKHRLFPFASEAHDAIDQWFHGRASNDHAKDALVDQIHGYLSRAVHVIWYEVPAHEKPIPLFTRLNQGRIPLTDAEL